MGRAFSGPSAAESRATASGMVWGERSWKGGMGYSGAR